MIQRTEHTWIEGKMTLRFIDGGENIYVKKENYNGIYLMPENMKELKKLIDRYLKEHPMEESE